MTALQAAHDSTPDVILLDMMLPKLGGPEVLLSLKQDPATARIPVIVLTGLSRKSEQKLRHDGAAAFLEKDNLLENPQPLLSAITAVLGYPSADKV